LWGAVSCQYFRRTLTYSCGRGSKWRHQSAAWLNLLIAIVSNRNRSTVDRANVITMNQGRIFLEQSNYIRLPNLIFLPKALRLGSFLYNQLMVLKKICWLWMLSTHTRHPNRHILVLTAVLQEHADFDEPAKQHAMTGKDSYGSTSAYWLVYATRKLTVPTQVYREDKYVVEKRVYVFKILNNPSNQKIF
jgi:hypothetical protein